jgi:hypothetical protein
MPDEFKDPTTDDEWQEAADLAHLWLALDAARAYGLIVGGPRVNIDRCNALLARAAERGVAPVPVDESIDRYFQ